MIPRILHHIWINRSDPALPERFAAYRQGWMRLHPGWEFRLWNLQSLDFPLRRPELLPRCASYAQLSDVLRLEVLYRYGGVYVDTDFECFRPIDELVDGADVFLCSENGIGIISNSVMGAAPRMPLFTRLLANLPGELGLQPPNVETGPSYLTRQLLSTGFGPGVMLVPSKSFYPYHPGEPVATAESHPQAYGAHHWAHSWAEPRRGLFARVLRRLWRRSRPVLALDRAPEHSNGLEAD